ncbi:MAG: hypothetical protein GC155_17910 [Alphaproteobacteria bacterium]|nr:hypothetical protein [Alphaproteobacteria bacterium]
MYIVLFVGLGVLALFAFDQIALWAERRGWIPYRKGRPGKGGVGAVIDGIESSINPAATPLTRTEEDLEDHPKT